MDRETGESSIKTAILNASDRVKRNINILRNEGFKNKSIASMDDEHPPKNQGIVKPLKSVNKEVWAKAKENVGHKLEYEELKEILATDFDAENQKVYDYYAATRDLEVDSPRTKKLEQIIENMNPDGNIVSRVIIMRKGKEASLEVAPDGTMLVSQSMLNLCDSEDEIAALFGHEMGHIKNKTFITKFASSRRFHDGIGWVHEALGADQESINYMEKGDYKVAAFATIIEKVVGLERGQIHQSGQMRAAQAYASFAVVNRTTSSNSEKPLDPDLKKTFELTNLEIVGELTKYGLENLSKKDSIKIARSLHPSDLGVVFKSREVRGAQSSDSKPNLRAAVENEVVKRVQDLGYTETHGDIFVQLQKADAHIYDTSAPIDSPRKFQNVCETLGDFNHTALVNEIHNKIFFSNDATFIRMQRDVMFGEIRYSSVEKYFYNHAAFEVFDKDNEPNGKGIPVTHETFINGMAALRRGRTEWEEGKIFANLVSEYLMSGVVGQDLANGKNVDVNKLGVFFTDFFNKGAGVNGEMLLRAVKDRYTHNKSFSFNHREYTMTDEQKESYINAIIEVFGIVEEEREPEKEITFDDIDKFLKTLESPQLNKYDSFEDRSFFLDLSSFLNNKKMTDAQRKLFVDHVISKLPDFKYRISTSAAKYFSDPQGFIDDLHEGSTDEMSAQEKERSETLYKFYVATLFISHIYQTDSEEFYASVDELCIASGIDFESLSKIELLNLCQELLLGNMNNVDPIILTSKYPITLEYSSSRHRINDYAKFSETIFMRAMLSKREVEANNLAELNQKLTEYKEAISFLNRGNFRSYREGVQIFEDDLLWVITGKDFVNTVQRILDKGVDVTEYDQLAQFLENCYPHNVEYKIFVAEIDKRYLLSEAIDIRSKINHLEKNFERIGFDGITIVSEQIKNRGEFAYFKRNMRKRLDDYMSGNEKVSMLAMGDYASSFVNNKFTEVFKTALKDDASIKATSNDFAGKWFYFMNNLSEFSTYQVVIYDKELKKYAVERGASNLFRSVRDYIETLQSLSPVERTSIVMKLLVDKDGGLSSDRNRKQVADLVLGSLNVDNDFLRQLLTAACTEADAKLVSFPIAQTVAPLLFRSLNNQVIDPATVIKMPLKLDHSWDYRKHIPKDVVEETIGDTFTLEDATKIITSPTRDIKIFGPRYKNAPGSALFEVAQANDAQYYVLTAKLHEILKINPKTLESLEQQEVETFGLTPETESIIRAGESSGPLGPRSFQLTSQFENLEPNIDARLSQSFDRNKGMSKLIFWINLDKLCDESEEVAAYVQHVELGEYKGGGSLQTTYQATYTDVDGNKEEVVLRMKNPNVELFVDEVYKSGYKSLEKVLKESRNKQTTKYARLGMMLLDLSREWCKADINDQGYEEADDMFRKKLDTFNNLASSDPERFVYAPARRLTHKLLKVETLGMGETVNKTLRDEVIKPEDKIRIVNTMSSLLEYEMNNPDYVDENGEEVFICRSDPHIGNLLAAQVENGQLIGVLDRDFYLHIKKSDIDIVKQFSEGKDPAKFINNLVDRVLDINKIRGSQRNIIKANILIKSGIQALKDSSDKMAFLRLIMTEMDVRKINTPLELRLMLRNVEAARRLNQRYLES